MAGRRKPRRFAARGLATAAAQSARDHADRESVRRLSSPASRRTSTGCWRESLETFHLYSFATLRQFGACFELAHTYLDWLAAQGEKGLEPESRAFRHISEGAKVLQFQLARAISRRKPLDLAPIDAMAEHWEHGISTLKSRYR